jgi:Reverse transcriptase (RNA-dependent DNA polymerase)
MTLETDLLARGFFPKEVVPPFVSESFAKFVESSGPASVLALIGKAWTLSTRHNLARPAGLRRPLSTPNPGAYLRIANATSEAWEPHILPIFNSTIMGASTPYPSMGPRAVAAKTKDMDLELLRAANRSGARYLLHADVQNFYPSIYTHSIDWAIHGKVSAKLAAKAKKKTPGSALDKAFQAAQGGQTVGIAIGSDASLIAAETIMIRVEEAINKKLPSVSGYRYWDDFELTFPSLRDADAGLVALQEALSSFELSLNPRKTRLVELPEPQEDAGIFDFRTWNLEAGYTQRRQLIGYFDAVYRHVAEDRGSTIAAFAVARLRSVNVDSENWALVQNNLLQLLIVEPSCARFVAEIITIARSNGKPLAIDAIGKAIEDLAMKHCPLGHGSEVAWSLWMAIANNIPIPQLAVSHITKMSDNFVALLTLHARSAGLVSGTIDTTYWETLLNAGELRGEHWLLAYEAAIKGWVPGQKDYIAKDTFFSKLRDNGVFFYDQTRISISKSAGVALSSGAGVSY